MTKTASLNKLLNKIKSETASLPNSCTTTNFGQEIKDLSDLLEKEITPKHGVYVSPVKIKRNHINDNEFVNHTEEIIYQILTLPFCKDTFVKSKNSCNYLEVYGHECSLFQTILKEYEPSLNTLHNLYVDKLLWLLEETIKTCFTHQENKSKTIETSHSRKTIRMDVRKKYKN